MQYKRIVDITSAIILLILFSLLMLTISLAVVLTMGKPVLFRQRRLGLHGKYFQILKFRTMRNCCNTHGHPLPDCERETLLGKILRNSGLDELPQLFNILKGDMSLVGPRPLLDKFVESCSEWQLRRYEVRPGITGLAQIRGRKSLDYDKRFELDVWYVNNESLLLDMKIIFITPFTLLRQIGCQETGRIQSTHSKEHISESERVNKPGYSSSLKLISASEQAGEPSDDETDQHN